MHTVHFEKFIMGEVDLIYLVLKTKQKRCKGKRNMHAYVQCACVCPPEGNFGCYSSGTILLVYFLILFLFLSQNFSLEFETL